MGKPLVRFCEGQEFNCDMDKILWHRRESRRKQRKQILPCSHGSLLSTRNHRYSILQFIDHERRSGDCQQHERPKPTR
jgi:hypothetical protein